MYTGEASTDFDAVNASSDTVEFTVADGDDGNSAIAYANTDITDSSGNTSNMETDEPLDITDGSPVTVDTTEPTAGDADTTVGSTTTVTVQLQDTWASDRDNVIVEGVNQVGTTSNSGDSFDEWTVDVNTETALQSIGVDASNGTITFNLKDASTVTSGILVKINMNQIEDAAGNNFVNSDTAENTVLEIEENGAGAWTYNWTTQPK